MNSDLTSVENWERNAAHERQAGMRRRGRLRNNQARARGNRARVGIGRTDGLAAQTVENGAADQQGTRYLCGVLREDGRTEQQHRQEHEQYFFHRVLLGRASSALGLLKLYCSGGGGESARSGMSKGVGRLG